MSLPQTPPPVEYLVIGHITQDIGPQGSVLGGTAAYAGLTAHALGWKTGVLTSTAGGMDLNALADLHIVDHISPNSTIFENIYLPHGRRQMLQSRARLLDSSLLPHLWRGARLAHLGPVAGEVDPDLLHSFPDAFLGLTPQGWMRGWNANGRVSVARWDEMERYLPLADAVVVSLEDVAGDEVLISEMRALCRLLVVTEGWDGARVYWQGEVQRFSAPSVQEIDPTGAGDIFSAVFFSLVARSWGVWNAARVAVQLASDSVARSALDSVPHSEAVSEACAQVAR